MFLGADNSADRIEHRLHYVVGKVLDWDACVRSIAVVEHDVLADAVRLGGLLPEDNITDVLVCDALNLCEQQAAAPDLEMLLD